MKNHNQLVEDYEDALFALLMESVAQQQGEALLEENERLKKDPGFAVPEKSTKRNLRLIRHALLRRELAGAGRVAMKVLNKVAMIVLVATAFFTTAFAAFPQFRADTLNLLIEVFEDKTKISFPSNGDISGETSGDFPFTVGWVPKGYELIEETVLGPTSTAVYQNTSGYTLTFNCDRLIGGSADIDTEDAIVQHIEINGYPALIAVKESEYWDGRRIQVVIMDTSRGKIVYVEAFDLTEEEMIRISKEIIF